MPRQASDDSTSVGRKCLRANVLLPDPLGPIRTTRDRLGMENFICCCGLRQVRPRRRLLPPVVRMGRDVNILGGSDELSAAPVTDVRPLFGNEGTDVNDLKNLSFAVGLQR